MFNFFKKSLKLYSPCDGKSFDLSQISDPVFAEKMSGDGVAIDVTGDTFVSPCDGELTFVFETNHAYGITTDDGIEILVHIGLDTVELKGEGFTRLLSPGTKVSAGTPIIKIDRNFILSKCYSLSTPLLIANMDMVNKLQPNLNQNVIAGKDVLLEYTLL